MAGFGKRPGGYRALKSRGGLHTLWREGIGGGEADAVFEGGTFGQGIGVVAEGFEQVEEEGLGFAFLVAVEFGGELGEGEEGYFEGGQNGEVKCVKSVKSFNSDEMRTGGDWQNGAAGTRGFAGVEGGPAVKE